MDTFLQNNSTLNHTQGLPVDPQDFLPLLKEYIRSPTAVVKFQEQIGLFGDELKFVQFELASTYRPPTPHAKTEPVVKEWEAFMEKVNKQASAAGGGAENVANGFQSGRSALDDSSRDHVEASFVQGDMPH